MFQFLALSLHRRNTMNSLNVTRYILSGGFITKASDRGRAFYRAIIGDQIRNAKVLICCFALPRENWVAAFDDEKGRFQLFNGALTMHFQNADPSRFADQVAWADVIVFRGGSTKSLMDGLSDILGWQKNLSGKTVVGSSAGAHMLSSSYLVTDAGPQLATGLGLLPVVIATHYQSTFIHDGDIDKSRVFWDKVDSLLKSKAGGKDVLALKEGDFQIVASDNS